MSIAQTAAPRTAPIRAPWSTANRVGLVIGGLFQAANILGVLLPSDGASQSGPPIQILVADTVLAAAGLVLVVVAWFTRRRVLARIAVAIAVVVALSAFPAFFVPTVPAALKVVAAGETVVALASSILILLPSRRRPAQP